MKQIKALTVAFWHVCKQLPGFFVERLAAYADEMEHINELRGRGGYTLEEIATLEELDNDQA